MILLALALAVVAPANGLSGGYDTANPFARILRGELAAARVYEDRWTLAFVPLTMVSPGHVLVIPKAPVRNILDLTPDQAKHLMATVQRIARAQAKALGATGIQLRQNNGADGGQTVFHLHVHVVPRYPGIPLQEANESDPPDPLVDRAAMAALLRAAIAR